MGPAQDPESSECVGFSLLAPCLTPFSSCAITSRFQSRNWYAAVTAANCLQDFCGPFFGFQVLTKPLMDGVLFSAPLVPP